MILEMPGLRPDNLMTYLAGLGLVRVVTTQFDPAAMSWWEGSTLMVDVARDDLVDFLIDAYRPTPILSPWNGGSGYGEKDKAPRQALNKLLTSGSPRLQAFVATDAVIRAVDQDKDKGTYVQRLRNSVPDAALPWIDAAVVLTTGPQGERRAVFPPLLGTGGNDGRYDFSTNFHQRLADVLPDLGARRPASRTWLESALDGRSVALAAATIGQFDPAAAGGPGTSAFDDAVSFVNPWPFVLMVEGLVSFASAPVRRFGEVAGRAAMPFTVTASPAGPTPGSEEEEARGELWAPVWNHPLGSRDIHHLFTSSRASWDGRTAVGAAHMYAALRSSGIDRRADRFFRYGFVQRNGLSYSAVLLDEVTVEARPEVEVGIAIEHRANPFLRVSATNRLAPVFAGYERARVRFYRDPGEAEHLLAVLAAATESERAVALTEGGRDAVSFAERKLRASEALPLFASLLADVPEYRIAAGLASGTVTVAEREWSMADLLIGRPPARAREPFQKAVVAGFGPRSLRSVLSELLVWRLAHRSDTRAPESAGVAVMDRYALSVPWQDVHAWASGALDDRLVETALMSMLALDWHGRLEREPWAPADAVPVPALAILQPFARQAVSATGLLDEASQRGIAPGWPAQLAAGTTSHVVAEAAALLQRSYVIQRGAGGTVAFLKPIGQVGPIASSDGQRLAAALWVPTNHTHALKRVTRLASQNSNEEIAS
ncbi:type I-G CRISPR-associated protein Cas8g1/Csx17 [Propionicicella superfundia]|uniref:type I-G CRISPR-associated protein Cas8g1/Csx17 n=1 Tax=Propionicicella superfundia TaxID=348582 RepID=UPI0004239F65|nr:type I-U CRISPR-associated protein Csx17 [Propionicicella superfundia]